MPKVSISERVAGKQVSVCGTGTVITMLHLRLPSQESRSVGVAQEPSSLCCT